jgi:hypothetical protein
VRFLEAILPVLRSMEGQLEEVTIKPGNNPKPAEKKEVTQNFFVIVEFGQSQGIRCGI